MHPATRSAWSRTADRRPSAFLRGKGAAWPRRRTQTTVDAQGRGRADNIDPADQWVLNPNTGDYELRLNPSAERSRPCPDRAGRPDAPRGQRAGPDRAGPRRHRPGPARRTDSREVPGQRRRRGDRRQPEPGRQAPAQAEAEEVAGEEGAAVDGRHDGLRAGRRRRARRTCTSRTSTATSTRPTSAARQRTASARTRPSTCCIIGTDKRTGKGNEGYGDKGSVGHADTNILLHVSKDRTNATALSIPRDLIVDIPTARRSRRTAREDHPGTPEQRPLQHQPRPGGPGPGLHHGRRSRRSPASRSTTS